MRPVPEPTQSRLSTCGGGHPSGAVSSSHITINWLIDNNSAQRGQGDLFQHFLNSFIETQWNNSAACSSVDEHERDSSWIGCSLMRKTGVSNTHPLGEWSGNRVRDL